MGCVGARGRRLVIRLRVAVVGGGVSGLCLAQGLRRDGVDVAVYERDPALDTRRQGYRIHLDARAGRALHACLPPTLYQLFRATLGTPGVAISVVDQRLKVLHRTLGVARDPDDEDPTTLSAAANRQTLREVLVAGLEDALAYGREFTDFEELPDGVRLRFADGSTEDCDVLVAADGVNSRVRRQYLPDARLLDTGGRCVYGKTLLTEETLALVPPTLFDGFTAVIGGSTVGMASALVRFRERPEHAAGRLYPGLAVSPVADYLMWAVTAPRERFGLADEQLVALDGGALHRLARDAIAGWHPDLRELVNRAEVPETFVVRISTSEPVPAWPASRVTLIGDAIHAMSPAGGSGANNRADRRVRAARRTGRGGARGEAVARSDRGVRGAHARLRIRRGGGGRPEPDEHVGAASPGARPAGPAASAGVPDPYWSERSAQITSAGCIRVGAVAGERVVVVEDDTEIGSELVQALAGHGFAAERAVDGASAVAAVLRQAPDLVLLDLGLPDVDGVALCRRLRALLPQAVVVVLTARTQELDVVVALDAGADDYLTKPFRLTELLARLRAHLRRQATTGDERPVTVGRLRLDVAARRATVDGQELALRPKEFDLLLALATQAGRVVTREDLMSQVWTRTGSVPPRRWMCT